MPAKIPPFLSLGRSFYAALGFSLEDAYRAAPKSVVVSAGDFNIALRTLIRTKAPAMVSRLGVSEASVALNWLEIEAVNDSSPIRRLHAELRGARRGWTKKHIDLLVSNAGFFPPNETSAANFARTFLDDFRLTDYLAAWGFVPGQMLLARKYCPAALQFEPAALEPYYFDDPWSESLEGQRVLVVHPFAESIKGQYSRHKLLFPGTAVLPDFELLTVKAVQSLQGDDRGHASWFDALQWMKDKIQEHEFDIALIGAGAYGVPLSAHVKRLGKIAIHMGGALQILFGIKGRRWDHMPAIAKFYNEHWVRPSASEQIPSAEKIEGGCYW